jgi:outer membrane protein OmpA-like peptidoglycan-associated protein
MRLWGLLAFAVGLGGLLLPGGAQAQELGNTPEDFISILKPSETAAVPGVRTRSLAPSTAAAPEAGKAGSGKIPDLRILFEFNSAELTAQARERLDVLGAALVSDDLRPFSFQIAGHTDAVGRPDYNLELSRERAEAVVNYLVSKWGIDPSRLDARGFGMTQLLVPDSGANPRNRRVEIETIVKN